MEARCRVLDEAACPVGGIEEREREREREREQGREAFRTQSLTVAALARSHASASLGYVADFIGASWPSPSFDSFAYSAAIASFGSSRSFGFCGHLGFFVFWFWGFSGSFGSFASFGFCSHRGFFVFWFCGSSGSFGSFASFGFCGCFAFFVVYFCGSSGSLGSFASFGSSRDFGCTG